jgi:hypothetical protein
MTWLSENIQLLLTMAGIAVALWQVAKARKAAEASRDASTRAERQIGRQVLLADIAISLRTLEETRTFIRMGRFEAGLIRLTDLTGQLTQIEQIELSSPHNLDLSGVLTQLSILQEVLERNVQDPKVPVDFVHASKTLTKVAARLHRWMGANKYALPGGPDDVASRSI